MNKVARIISKRDEKSKSETAELRKLIATNSKLNKFSAEQTVQNVSLKEKLASAQTRLKSQQTKNTKLKATLKGQEDELRKRVSE